MIGAGPSKLLERTGDGLALVLLGLVLLPVLALVVAGSPTELIAGMRHPLVGPALALSLRTSLVSLAVIVGLGTPLAWRLARTEGRGAQLVEALIDLPVVLPPAVLGIGLIYAYGRSGILGGLPIAFTAWAVVAAQVVVAAPFYVQSATAAFRGVDDELLLVARTLGASPARAWWRVAVPAALPGVVAGAALAWARALGEFGATLLFAGNLPGRTQTMPLAIYSALETDVDAARSIAVLLAAFGLAALVALRWTTSARVGAGGGRFR